MTAFDLYAPGLEQAGLGLEKLLYAQGRKDVNVLAIAEDVGLWLSACRLREHGGNNGFFQAQGGARAAKSTLSGRSAPDFSISAADRQVFPAGRSRLPDCGMSGLECRHRDSRRWKVDGLRPCTSPLRGGSRGGQ